MIHRIGVNDWTTRQVVLEWIRCRYDMKETADSLGGDIGQLRDALSEPEARALVSDMESEAFGDAVGQLQHAAVSSVRVLRETIENDELPTRDRLTAIGLLFRVAGNHEDRKEMARNIKEIDRMLSAQRTGGLGQPELEALGLSDSDPAQAPATPGEDAEWEERPE